MPPTPSHQYVDHRTCSFLCRGLPWSTLVSTASHLPMSRTFAFYTVYNCVPLSWVISTNCYPLLPTGLTSSQLPYLTCTAIQCFPSHSTPRWFYYGIWQSAQIKSAGLDSRNCKNKANTPSICEQNALAENNDHLTATRWEERSLSHQPLCYHLICPWRKATVTLKLSLVCSVWFTDSTLCIIQLLLLCWYRHVTFAHFYYYKVSYPIYCCCWRQGLTV